MSLNNSRTSSDHYNGARSPYKRQRMGSSFGGDEDRLIPCLPNEISLQILARLPRVHYLEFKLVSRGWKATITSPELYNWRRELGTMEEWLFIMSRSEGRLLWHALDPVSQKWQNLPLMPFDSMEAGFLKGSGILHIFDAWGPSSKIVDALRGWLGKGDAYDKMQFSGCSIGAVNGCLYVLGGLSRISTLKAVWRYDPVLNAWSEVCPMAAARAYSKTGVLKNKLYVVGGVNKGRNGLTPLQSVEVFDPEAGLWSEIPSMPFSKAHILPTAFLADLLQPIATGLTTYRGKLYVPQSLYHWPFFVDAGGEVYDPETNSWIEMPNGMGEGWPSKQAGTKVSAVVEDELYALDPSSTMDTAKLRVYDSKDDAWKVVPGEVSIYDDAEAESPYLLSNLRGKLHVITKDSNHDITVLQADTRNNMVPLLSASLRLVNTSRQKHAVGAEESASSIWRVVARRKGLCDSRSEYCKFVGPLRYRKEEKQLTSALVFLLQLGRRLSCGIGLDFEADWQIYIPKGNFNRFCFHSARNERSEDYGKLRSSRTLIFNTVVCQVICFQPEETAMVPSACGSCKVHVARIIGASHCSNEYTTP
ncbi:F-box/kelch-repeat protein-like protein [Drosera capensis]